MDLKEFTSPLPKPWLNINANSVKVGPGGGSTVSSTAYSQVAPLVAIPGSTTRFSLSGNAAAVGSLTIGPLPVGAVVRSTAQVDVSYNAGIGGGFSTFATVDGTAIMTLNNQPGVNVAGNLTIEAKTTILPGDLAFTSLVASLPAGIVASGLSGSYALSSATAHAYDLALRFPSAGSLVSAVCTQYFVEVLNGA